MGKRIGLSKRVRFAVFARDGFTCRYCGRQPGDVKLVVDHIIPVVEGEQVKEADGEQAIRRLMEATFSTWPNELVSWKKAAVLEFGRAVWREAIGAPQRTMGCIGCGSSDADCDCDEAGEG